MRPQWLHSQILIETNEGSKELSFMRSGVLAFFLYLLSDVSLDHSFNSQNLRTLYFHSTNRHTEDCSLRLKPNLSFVTWNFRKAAARREVCNFANQF